MKETKHDKKKAPALVIELVGTARKLLEAGMLIEAEYILRRATQYDPLYPPAYALLGYSLEAQHRWDDAMEVLGVVKQMQSFRAGVRALAGE